MMYDPYKKLTRDEIDALSEAELEAYHDAFQRKLERSEAAAYKILQKRNHKSITSERVFDALSGLVDNNSKEEPISLAAHAGIDQESMSIMSSLLLYEMYTHKELLDSGETHVGRRQDRLPKSLIAYLAGSMLQRYVFYSMPIDIDLLCVIKHLLGVFEYGLKEVQNLDEQRAAAVHVANEPNISVTELAGKVGVDKATTSRWLKNPEFRELVNYLKEHPEIKPIMEPGWKSDGEIELQNWLESLHKKNRAQRTPRAYPSS